MNRQGFKSREKTRKKFWKKKREEFKKRNQKRKELKK